MNYKIKNNIYIYMYKWKQYKEDIDFWEQSQ